MSTALADYQKKQEELKALEQKAIDEVMGSISESLQTLKKGVATLKVLSPSTNIAELSDWKSLSASVNPFHAVDDKTKPAGAKRGRKPGAKVKKVVVQSKTTKTKKRAPRTLRKELSEQAVLGFIGAGHKTKGELVGHFAGGAAKVVKFLKGLGDKLDVKKNQGPKANAVHYSKK